MTTFYLGTHQPHWLGRTDVPLFVSRRTLAPRRRMPRARGRWALDSGGFTELSMYGRWETSAAQYVADVRRIIAGVGRPDFAAPRDWMCEPWIIRQTGLTVAEHQRRTVADYLDVRDRAPELPWAPVLQGWSLDDYLRCIDLYERAGVGLAALPVVGVGTVCRRQGTHEGRVILETLAAFGLRLHGFGLKLTGLAATAPILASADSLAWSYAARRAAPLPGCIGHKNCANCLRYALAWRERVLETIAGAAPAQLRFAA
jgi:hypothetical protein